MKPTDFDGSNTAFAKEKEYIPLPAHRANGTEGIITTCWRTTWRERIRIAATGRVWLQVMSFNQPPQPLLMSAERPAHVPYGIVYRKGFFRGWSK